jgi:hypothetical protein
MILDVERYFDFKKQGYDFNIYFNGNQLNLKEEQIFYIDSEEGIIKKYTGKLIDNELEVEILTGKVNIIKFYKGE